MGACGLLQGAVGHHSAGEVPPTAGAARGRRRQPCRDSQTHMFCASPVMLASAAERVGGRSLLFTRDGMARRIADQKPHRCPSRSCRALLRYEMHENQLSAEQPAAKAAAPAALRCRPALRPRRNQLQSLQAQPSVPPLPLLSAACLMQPATLKQCCSGTRRSRSIQCQPIWVQAVVSQVLRRHQPAVPVPGAQAAVAGRVVPGGVSRQIEEALMEGNVHRAGPVGLQARSEGTGEANHKGEPRSGGPASAGGSPRLQCTAAALAPMAACALRPARAHLRVGRQPVLRQGAVDKHAQWLACLATTVLTAVLDHLPGVKSRQRQLPR